MGTDLILINCPVWAVSEPPLGLAYLATYLEEAGFSIKVIDLNIQAHGSEAISKEIWINPRPYDRRILFDVQPLMDNTLRQIADIRPLLVGFSVNQFNLAVSVEMGKRARRLASVVFGGPECFLKPDRDRIPQDAADYFVAYDGELALKLLLTALKSNQNPLGVPGIIPSAECHGEFAESPTPMAPLSSIPMPTFNEFVLDAYSESALPVMMSRGCSRRCVFCNDRSYHHSFRKVHLDSFVDGIERYMHDYGIFAFSFHDAAVNADMNLLRDFCREVIRRRLAFSWRSNAFVHNGLNDEMFGLLKRSGCEALTFGIESLSEAVLRKMRKGFSRETAEKVLRSCKRAGIEVLINLIVGFPNESEHSLDETIRFLKEHVELIDRVLNLSTCFVAPKSELEVNPEKYGIILPENHFYKWYTKQGNTNSLRIERLMRVRKLLDDLNIPCITMNVIRDEEKIEKLS